MTAREIKEIDKEISRLCSKRARLEAAVENTSPKLTGMPQSTGTADKVGDIVAMIADINSEIAELKARKKSELERLSRDNFIENCLYLHFRMGWSWTKISMRTTDGRVSADGIRKACYRCSW